MINKFVAGVFLGLSDGTPVQHNAIHDVPHHTINLGLAQDERGNLSAGSVTKTRGVYLDDFTSNCFVHGNIVFSASEASLLLVLGVGADDPITDSDQNLYCVAGGRWAVHDELTDGRTAAKHRALAEWQQRGFDRHSVTGDPDFANPQRADYSLLTDSPAHALSIVGIDQARIGPRSGRAR